MLLVLSAGVGLRTVPGVSKGEAIRDVYRNKK